MSGWASKRFWTDVAVVEDGGGFVVELDGRRLKTPARAEMRLPTRPMAAAVAAEWDAQQGEITPSVMPVTGSANAAIDKVSQQRGDVAALLAAYGDADLLCYRAGAPVELSARQAAAWDPALDWAERELGARLSARTGVIHEPQSAEALARLSGLIHDLTVFQLAAFHDLVSLSGSLILAFAAVRDWRDAEFIWRLSRLDESWQQEHWGRDDEAIAAAEHKRLAFLHAKRFYDFS